MFALISQTIQFLVFHLLIRIVDRVSRLSRGGVQPEVERLLRENVALKTEVRASCSSWSRRKGSAPGCP